MSLKDKVVSWQNGVEHAEAGRFGDAIDNFTEIPEPSARIFFNISSAFLRQGNLEDAERVSWRWKNMYLRSIYLSYVAASTQNPCSSLKKL